MKKEYAMRWAAALESGRYQQTAGTLCNGKCYCALGVLCDTVKEEVGMCWVKEYGPSCVLTFGRPGFEEMFDSSTAALPSSVCKLTGISNRNGRINDDGVIIGSGYFSITEMNDNRRLTFAEIAAFIRKHYDAL
jgi:hypothetical protein